MMNVYIYIFFQYEISMTLKAKVDINGKMWLRAKHALELNDLKGRRFIVRNRRRKKRFCPVLFLKALLTSLLL